MLSFFKPAFHVLLLVASASAALRSTRLHRTKRNVNNVDTSSYCGQWDSVSAGAYSLSLDQWGKNDAISGGSCASLISLSGTTVAWYTTWNWAGDGNQVKSFTNIQLNQGINTTLSEIHSIQAKWHWTHSSYTDVVADIAYDFFTSTSPGGAPVNEIMVWLANFNSGPISFHYDYLGHAIPIASNIPLVGHEWNLYYGSNGVNLVYSFLPANGSHIKRFHGDLNVFLQHLISEKHIADSEFLICAQGGTEATTGSAAFNTSAYSLAINSTTGGSGY